MGWRWGVGGGGEVGGPGIQFQSTVLQHICLVAQLQNCVPNNKPSCAGEASYASGGQTGDDRQGGGGEAVMFSTTGGCWLGDKEANEMETSMGVVEVV